MKKRHWYWIFFFFPAHSTLIASFPLLPRSHFNSQWELLTTGQCVKATLHRIPGSRPKTSSIYNSIKFEENSQLSELSEEIKIELTNFKCALISTSASLVKFLKNKPENTSKTKTRNRSCKRPSLYPFTANLVSSLDSFLLGIVHLFGNSQFCEPLYLWFVITTTGQKKWWYRRQVNHFSFTESASLKEGSARRSSPVDQSRDMGPFTKCMLYLAACSISCKYIA